MPIKPCRHDIESLLHKKADGRLTPDEAEALERQVAACATCQERSALLEWANNSLRQDPRALPVGLVDGVMRRAAELRPSRRLLGRSPTPAVRWLPATAAVLALGVVVLVVLGPFRRTPSEPPRVQVDLQLVSEKARSVAVVGDFNDWSTVAMKKGEDEIWRIRLSLPPGRYQYAFVIDRDKWIADPEAATVVDSGYGGVDSVLDLSI